MPAHPARLRGAVVSGPDIGRERSPFPLLSPPGLVIFDCDGVLVDSETIQNGVLASMLVRHGVPATVEDVMRRYTGWTIPALIEDVAARTGVRLDHPWTADLYRETEAAFRSGLQPIAHVQELVLALKHARIPFCVASNGAVSKMHVSLGVTGLLGHFGDRLHSGHDMEHGKPFPDLFLRAAKVMGVTPEDCVVIEDSAAGLKAAQAAGMKALAYVASPAHAPAVLSGGHPFSDMRQVPALLGLPEGI